MFSWDVELANGMGETEKLFVTSQENGFLEKSIGFLIFWKGKSFEAYKDNLPGSQRLVYF